MTGKQIRTLREQLHLGTFALAGVLGVHVSTIYRWEAVASATVHMDPLQGLLMEKLHATVEACPQEGPALGQLIIDGLVTGGPLAALLALLRKILEWPALSPLALASDLELRRELTEKNNRVNTGYRKLLELGTIVTAKIVEEEANDASSSEDPASSRKGSS